MLPRTSPKCRLIHQVATNLTLKLTICIVILICSLATVQFFLLINNNRLKKTSENVKEIRLDKNSSYIEARRSLQRRNDFLPEQVIKIGDRPMSSNTIQDVSGKRQLGELTESTSESKNRQIVIPANKHSTMGMRGTVHREPVTEVRSKAAPDHFRSDRSQQQQHQGQANNDESAQILGVDFGESVHPRVEPSRGEINRSKFISKPSRQARTNFEDKFQAHDEPILNDNNDNIHNKENDMIDEASVRKSSPSKVLDYQELLDQIPESMDSLMNSGGQDDLLDMSAEDVFLGGNGNNNKASSHHQSSAQRRSAAAAASASKIRPPSQVYVENDEDDSDMELDGPRHAVKPVSSLDDEDLKAAAGHSYSKKKKKKKKHHHHHHHGHDHGKYYMYAKVPKKKTWEFGYKKGNKKHWIERHEKGHKNKFKTKVKWYDKKSKGKGIHIWDYNHHDKKHHG